MFPVQRWNFNKNITNMNYRILPDSSEYQFDKTVVTGLAAVVNFMPWFLKKFEKLTLKNI